jgi:DNA invertase Pin-like site-specific DNA recombinase
MAEFERDKIIERTTRGRLHRLRMGQVMSNGNLIYGYDFVKKTPTSPAALAINETQAAVVRSIFEAYATGQRDFSAIEQQRLAVVDQLEQRRLYRGGISRATARAAGRPGRASSGACHRFR